MGRIARARLVRRKFLQLALQRATVDSQAPCSLGYVSATIGKDALDVLPFGTRETWSPVFIGGGLRVGSYVGALPPFARAALVALARERLVAAAGLVAAARTGRPAALRSSWNDSPTAATKRSRSGTWS